MAYISPNLTAIANAVKKTSTALTRDFNELEHLQNSVHNDGRFAQRSYEKVIKTLTEELAKFKPAYGVVCRSQDAIPASNNYFLISPIDGYTNFAHGNGAFAVSVAMVENGVITAGVVYNPVYDELFFAEKGSGAFKEGFRSHERIRVAGNKAAEKSLIACPADATVLQNALALSPNVIVKGSTALNLAYLASGKVDVAIAKNALPQEIAAGILLIKEAGGYVLALGETDVRSEDLNKVLFSGNLIACNEALRQKTANAMANK